jgi:hypothetical protein
MKRVCDVIGLLNDIARTELDPKRCRHTWMIEKRERIVGTERDRLHLKCSRCSKIKMETFKTR